MLDIANGCWNEKRQDYRGFQYLIAVGQAKRGIEKKRGGNRDRTAEAKHQVSVLFNHARQQTPETLSTVAQQAAAGSGDDLTGFASEVTGLLNGVHSGGFGIIDPGMIIALISAIISAVQACRVKPVPVPVPTP